MGRERSNGGSSSGFAGRLKRRQRNFHSAENVTKYRKDLKINTQEKINKTPVKKTTNKHGGVKGSCGTCWTHGKINRLRPSQVTERHGLEAMRGAGLTSNKGAYTRLEADPSF